MKSNIIKRIIISFLIVVLCSTTLFYAQKKTAYASELVGLSLGGAAIIASVLAAFGVHLAFNENSSNSEIISTIEDLCTMDSTFQWDYIKNKFAVTSEGKIYARQDTVNDLLGHLDFGDYSVVRFNDSIYYKAHSVGVTDIGGVEVSIPTDAVYEENQVISSVNVDPYLNLSDYIDSFYGDPVLSNQKRFKAAVVEFCNSLQGQNKYIGFNPQQTSFKILSCDLNDLVGKTISGISYSSSGLNDYYTYRFNTTEPITFTQTIVGFSGNVSTTTVEQYYIMSGLRAWNTPQVIFPASNIVSGSSDLLGNIVNTAVDTLSGGLEDWYDYIGNMTGTLLKEGTAPDVIGVQEVGKDIPIDYPLENVGIGINTGVIADNFNEWVDNVIERLKSGTIDLDLAQDQILEVPIDASIEQVITSDDALTWEKTAQETFTDEKEIEESTTSSGYINNVAMIDGLGTFFPFCIPYDLYAIVKSLNVPAKAPKFTYTLDFTSINMGTHDIDINLSDYETVCTVFKIMLFIGFLIFLTLKTRDMIRG